MWTVYDVVTARLQPLLPLESSAMIFRSLVVLCVCFSFANFSHAQGTINLLPGDMIDDNTVIPSGTTVNVLGGSIGLGVDLSDGILNVESGTVAMGASSIATGFTNSNNQVNISGGTVGGFFQLTNGTELTITDGEIESFGLFGSGAMANIIGGTVSRFPDIFSGGVVNISGGDVFAVRVFDGGEVNFTGTEFFIDGVALDLTIGEEFVIDQRNVNLSGTLADGSFIETDLNTTFGGFFSDNPDGAGANAIVTVTAIAAVPEPAAATLLILAGSFLCTCRRRSAA